MICHLLPEKVKMERTNICEINLIDGCELISDDEASLNSPPQKKLRESPLPNGFELISDDEASLNPTPQKKLRESPFSTGFESISDDEASVDTA